MSPRRSSRARTTGPPPPQPTSSTSSTSQNRAERSTRSHNKRDTSSTQRSESHDDSTTGNGQSLAPRRSKRGVDQDNDDSVKTPLDDEDEEEEPEVEEITRCVCGFSEYPGPPLVARESALRVVKPGVKEENGVQPSPEALPEDAGNFFIQCDKCQVWQHGGCVGLMDESMSPEEYFCEQCKPSMHKIVRSANGSKSTRYLPVLEAKSPRSSSTSSSSEVVRVKDSKQKAKDLSTRRRATMNSRDAAYDEEEMMRRAIEESKMTSGTLGKRAREDSEDKSSSAKRLRTDSASTDPKRSPSPLQPASEDEDEAKSAANGASKKAKAAAARNQREETREKQKELDRQKREEAAGRRNARSERRRGDDTPPPTPSLSPSKQEAKITNSESKSLQPDTPSHRPGSGSNHRKTGRPPARRGRMRHHNTRDPTNGDDSPMRDTSGDGHGSPHGVNGHGHNGESGRPSRPKYLNPNRTSLNEMKRRVAGIIEFVSRLQTEHVGSSSDGSAGTPDGIGMHGEATPSPGSLIKEVEAGLALAKKRFREMSSKDMMEELMKGALNWQTAYGKYGEK